MTREQFIDKLTAIELAKQLDYEHFLCVFENARAKVEDDLPPEPEIREATPCHTSLLVHWPGKQLAERIEVR